MRSNSAPMLATSRRDLVTRQTPLDAAYTLFGAYANYRFNSNWSTSARVRNLTDKIYAASVTGTPMFYLGAPRTFELQVQAAF